MKKQVILMAAAAAVAMPMISEAQVMGAGNGATLVICTNGKMGADGTSNPLVSTSAETALQFLKKQFKPSCSANVDMAASETNVWMAIGAASRKGKYILGGNTEGASPSCLKAAATDAKCDETTTNLVNPTNSAAHIAVLQAAAVSGAGSTAAKFSPCFLISPAPAGC